MWLEAKVPNKLADLAQAPTVAADQAAEEDPGPKGTQNTTIRYHYDGQKLGVVVIWFERQRKAISEFALESDSRWGVVRGRTKEDSKSSEVSPKMSKATSQHHSASSWLALCAMILPRETLTVPMLDSTVTHNSDQPALYAEWNNFCCNLAQWCAMQLHHAESDDWGWQPTYRADGLKDLAIGDLDEVLRMLRNRNSPSTDVSTAFLCTRGGSLAYFQRRTVQSRTGRVVWHVPTSCKLLAFRHWLALTWSHVWSHDVKCIQCRILAQDAFTRLKMRFVLSIDPPLPLLTPLNRVITRCHDRLWCLLVKLDTKSDFGPLRICSCEALCECDFVWKTYDDIWCYSMFRKAQYNLLQNAITCNYIIIKSNMSNNFQSQETLRPITTCWRPMPNDLYHYTWGMVQKVSPSGGALARLLYLPPWDAASTTRNFLFATLTWLQGIIRQPSVRNLIDGRKRSFWCCPFWLLHRSFPFETNTLQHVSNILIPDDFRRPS